MSNDTAMILNNLITTSKDGEEGFRIAAENASNPTLKQTLLERAESCKQAAEVLQAHVAGLGAAPAESGSVLGAVHRRWVDLKSLFTGHDDHAILIECEGGEDVAKASYEKALAEDLPEDIRIIVQYQYEGVLKNHDLVRDLRDQYAAKKENSSLRN